MQDNNIQNLLRLLNQFGRTTRQTTIIDNGEFVDGVMVSKETRASVNGSNVDIDETSYHRMLDCGHIAMSPSDVTASCDVCGRWVCENCLFVCSRCNLHTCHRCCKVYSDNGVEKILCSACLWDTKRKDNVKKAFCFFVKVKEEK